MSRIATRYLRARRKSVSPGLMVWMVEAQAALERSEVDVAMTHTRAQRSWRIRKSVCSFLFGVGVGPGPHGIFAPDGPAASARAGRFPAFAFVSYLWWRAAAQALVVVLLGRT